MDLCKNKLAFIEDTIIGGIYIYTSLCEQWNASPVVWFMFATFTILGESPMMEILEMTKQSSVGSFGGYSGGMHRRDGTTQQMLGVMGYPPGD